MSTSDKTALHITGGYVAVSVLTAVFGAVYELFGHGVYSYYMLYAFAFPLLLGVVPFLIMALGGFAVPSRLTRQIYHSGVATATVGSLFQGVLAIYGTTSRLSTVYLLAAVILLVIAIARAVIDYVVSDQPQDPHS